jgi:hypothetical protein
MALAAYKDLCIDAAEPALLGRFWADALRLELHLHDDGDAHLTGPTPQHTVWINRVPEPKTVKHRLHLDVHVASIEEVVALGATVVDADSFRWTLMTDPEEGEFCVFVREQPPEFRLYELAQDCADAAATAGWWAELIGGRLVHDAEGFSFIEEIPGAPFDSITFAPVPEPKTVKNRVHIDVTTADVAAIVAAGATVIAEPTEQTPWTVLSDPEGNEFCAFPPPSVVEQRAPASVVETT